MTARIEVVRVYGNPGRSGAERRVLVDRPWPRRVNEEAVDLYEWVSDVAPSIERRR